MTDSEPFAPDIDAGTEEGSSGKGKEKVVSVRRNRSSEKERLASVDTERHAVVRLAMLKIGTSTAPTNEYDVDLVVDCMRKAEQVFAAENPYIRNQLRIFIAPEWFFRKPGDPYSHAEMRHIVDELLHKTGTEEFGYWLVIPGTIYFGLGYDHKIPEDELDNVCDEIERYFALPQRAPAPIRQEPENNPTRWFVGNLAVAAFRGQILGYHFKTFQQDIDSSRKKVGDPIERWAMEALPLRDRLNCAHNPFFRVPDLGLEIALEICRDHNRCTDQVYYRGFWRGPGTHIHVMMCFGVEFRKAACVARKGGYFLRCDGAKAEVQTYLIDAAAPGLPPGEVFDQWRAGEDMPAFLHKTRRDIDELKGTQAILEEEKVALEGKFRRASIFKKAKAKKRLAAKEQQLKEVAAQIGRLSLDTVERSGALRKGWEAWDREGQRTLKTGNGTLGKTTYIDVDHGGKLAVYEGKMEFDVLPLSRRKT